MGSWRPADAAATVRVTVAAPTRRVDLVLPAGVPVAELVPELARSVGMLDPVSVHGGHRLVTPGGRELVGRIGLAAQGIEDGGLLALVPGQEAPVKVYDDVAEAMADVVEHDLESRRPEFGRRAALATAVLLATLGGLALATAGSLVAGSAASVAALSLVGGAGVLSRVRRDSRSALGVAWMGASYAAVAGFVLAQDGGSFALAVAFAGAGAASAGLVCLLALGSGRLLAIPPIVVGGVFLMVGLLTRVVPVQPAVVLTTALAIFVMIGSFVPALALGVTGAMADQPLLDGDASVDTDRLSADARAAHQIVIAASATAGLLLLSVAPFAVSLGASGTALAVTCSLVVLLRARRHRAASQAQVGLVSGTAGLLSAVGASLLLHPGWRPTTAIFLATAGIVVLAMTLLPSASSARWARWCDLVESAALLAILPQLVAAVGAVAMIGG